jgi:Sensors of blue-light using FAD
VLTASIFIDSKLLCCLWSFTSATVSCHEQGPLLFQDLTMQRLLYISCAGEEFSDRNELNELGEDAVQRNKQSDLTGALFYVDGYFMQLLEGPGDEVSETFLRIKSDSRHSEVEVLFLEEASERIFPNWSMSCNVVDIKGASSDLHAAVDGLRQGVENRTITDSLMALEYFFAPNFLR